MRKRHDRLWSDSMLGRREFARDTYVDDARPGYHEPYGHDNLDLVDDALILSGLADVLEPLPSLATKTEDECRQRMIAACRTAAQQVAEQSGSDQPFEDARGYAGDEWRNELLLALVGADDEAERLLTQVDRTAGYVGLCR